MFGDGIYEVIRSYSGRLFKASDHLARLHHSLAAVRIRLPEPGRLLTIAEDLLRRNGLAHVDAIVYIQVTRGAAARQLVFPERAVPTLYLEAVALARPADERGVSVITVTDTRWQRCDIKAIGLLPNVLARQAATEAGADEAVFVRHGLVTEGTHTSVFAARGGAVLTHPAGPAILPGITRSVVLELCSALRIPVSETPVPAADLPGLDEVFLACTTGEVMSVVRVDSRPVGAGTPGPLTRRLQAAFRDYVRSAV
jgi:D-alanine transaminase